MAVHNQGKMQPVARLELLKHRANVRFHGAFRDPQLTGDFLVAGAIGNRPGDFLFAPGQR